MYVRTRMAQTACHMTHQEASARWLWCTLLDAYGQVQLLAASSPSCKLCCCRLPVGYLGGAPAWSFYGPRQRRPLTAGGSHSLSCPLAPTSASSPGPGAYATACSAFGRQVLSSATSNPAASVPRAQRDELLRQALPRGQEHVLMGRASPGPCCPQASSLGRHVTSRARNSNSLEVTGSVTPGLHGRRRPAAMAAAPTVAVLAAALPRYKAVPVKALAAQARLVLQPHVRSAVLGLHHSPRPGAYIVQALTSVDKC
ncbi:hypothetical protein COO60DRAFT_225454 [Scenedesmus sp. NREL 46B-D3]|nr:hypothetical protein COO60DRAFT_225454 [Scenedesmus sp. NREL 46B-D3]